MVIRTLSGSKDPHYWSTLELYVETFPRDEREPLSRVAAVAAGELPGGPEIRIAELGGEFAGFIYFMRCPSQSFLIYIAVMPHFRKNGIVAELLRYLRQNAPYPCLLECEPPVGPDQHLREKRLEFFRGHGAVLLSKTYVQPSLGPGREPVPLWLLAIGDVPNPEAAIRTHYAQFFELNGDTPEIAAALSGLQLH